MDIFQTEKKGIGMARALRIEFPGLIYHGMSRGIDGRSVFGSSQDFLEFLKRVGTTVNRMLMYLLAEKTSLNLTEVGRWTGRTTSGVSRAVRDIRRQLKCDRRMASRVEILSLQLAGLFKDQRSCALFCYHKLQKGNIQDTTPEGPIRFRCSGNP